MRRYWKEAHIFQEQDVSITEHCRIHNSRWTSLHQPKLHSSHKTHYSAASVDSRKKLPYFDDTSSLLAVSGDFERSSRGDLGLDLDTDG